MAKRSHWLVWLVGVSMISSVLVSLPAALRMQTATAVGGYDNAAIADTALRYVGRWGAAACVDAGRSGATGGAPLGDGNNADGECKAFVNCIVWMASGHTQWPAGGYSSAFLAAGAQEVSLDAATKGDIIQWEPVGNNLHTAIVVENRGGGIFRVVDSNWGYTRRVNDHVMNVHMSGFAAPRFFRLGTVNAAPSDRDSDGTPDASDRCPDQAGPTNTGGCPDTDGDAVADLDDLCRYMSGLPGLYGCPESEVNPMQVKASDFNGDSKADYCRRVGGTNGVNSFVACTLSTGTGFGKTALSPVLDWGYDTGRAWVDATGDGKADYCRVVGSTNGQDSKLACTLSTNGGFGATITSPTIDWGYETGRAWVDFNGDSKADYCRRVGGTNGVNSFVACTLSTGTGFGKTALSPVLDWGYDTGRAWVDATGDGKADYCRVVGSTNGQDSKLACTLSTNGGFGATITSPTIDWGYETGRAWVDFNGDSKADYCRRVGGTNGVNSFVACTLSTGTGFGKTALSPVLDWGYDTGRAWVDATGDGKADYCRVVGSTNGQDSKLACTLSTNGGFGATITSPTIDWGYETGRAWVDFNGDSKADYCRRVGGTNGVNSFVACTLSTGTGFGKTALSPVLDWGYDTGRAWVGHSIQAPSQTGSPRPDPAPSVPGTPSPAPSDPGTTGPEPVSTTPPGGVRQQSIRIKAKAVKKASRLAINANPDRPRIRIQIRQRTSRGRWKDLMTRTLHSPHNTLVINVDAGFYRVFAPSQKHLTAGKSRVVRIRR